MERILTNADVEPIINRAHAISEGDGHVQFSLLVSALVLTSKLLGVSRETVHRGIDVTWDYDGRKPSPPISLVQN